MADPPDHTSLFNEIKKIQRFRDDSMMRFTPNMNPNLQDWPNSINPKVQETIDNIVSNAYKNYIKDLFAQKNIIINEEQVLDMITKNLSRLITSVLYEAYRASSMRCNTQCRPPSNGYQQYQISLAPSLVAMLRAVENGISRGAFKDNDKYTHILEQGDTYNEFLYRHLSIQKDKVEQETNTSVIKDNYPIDRKQNIINYYQLKFNNQQIKPPVNTQQMQPVKQQFLTQLSSVNVNDRKREISLQDIVYVISSDRSYMSTFYHKIAVLFRPSNSNSQKHQSQMQQQQMQHMQNQQQMQHMQSQQQMPQMQQQPQMQPPSQMQQMQQMSQQMMQMQQTPMSQQIQMMQMQMQPKPK